MKELKSQLHCFKFHLSNGDATVIVEYDIHEDILKRVRKQCDLQGWDINKCSLVFEIPDFFEG